MELNSGFTIISICPGAWVKAFLAPPGLIPSEADRSLSFRGEVSYTGGGSFHRAPSTCNQIYFWVRSNCINVGPTLGYLEAQAS